MTLDDHFRDQISRGQPPLIALHNAAQAYAESLKPRDCSQYADETAAWSEPDDVPAASSRRRSRAELRRFFRERREKDSEAVKWYVIVDESLQDELGNGPQGIAITPHEDDVVDAIAWMQEGTYEDAVVMAKSRETAKALTEAVELLRKGERLMSRRIAMATVEEMLWHDRVRKFLDGRK